MCIIVQQPDGYVFDKHEIRDFYGHNSDGFGFMWHDASGCHGIRSLAVTADHAEALYYEHCAGKAGVLHYRMATSGPKTVKQVHPFEISPSLLMMHNGVLDRGTDTESDTERFVRLILQPLLGADHRRLYDSTVQRAIETLSKGSGLVFLDTDGVLTKLGYDGVEYDRCWYSNTYAWDAPKSLSKWWNQWDLDDYRSPKIQKRRVMRQLADGSLVEVDSKDDTDPSAPITYQPGNHWDSEKKRWVPSDKRYRDQSGQWHDVINHGYVYGEDSDTDGVPDVVDMIAKANVGNPIGDPADQPDYGTAAWHRRYGFSDE